MSAPLTRMVTLLCLWRLLKVTSGLFVFSASWGHSNTPDKNGFTLAHAAAHSGHEKAVKLLRKLQSDFGTPIELARQRGQTEVAEKPIKYTSQCARCEKKATAIV